MGYIPFLKPGILSRLAIAGTLAVSLTSTLEAAQFHVKNLQDHGAYSLREAMLRAKDGDIIKFDAHLSGTIHLEGPLPVIDNNLTIIGPTEGRAGISGDNRFQVLFVNRGRVSVSDLGIYCGLSQGGTRGHSLSGNGGGGLGAGGGIFVNSDAMVFLSHISFESNSARGGMGGGIITDISNGAGGGGGGGYNRGNGGNGEYDNGKASGGGGGGCFCSLGGSGLFGGGGGGAGGFSRIDSSSESGRDGNYHGGRGGVGFGCVQGGRGGEVGQNGIDGHQQHGGGGGGGGVAINPISSGGMGGFGGLIGGGGGGGNNGGPGGNGGDFGGGGGAGGGLIYHQLSFGGAGGFGGGGGGGSTNDLGIEGGKGGIGGFGSGGGGGGKNAVGGLGGLSGGKGGNDAGGGGGGSGMGGAIFVRSGGYLVLQHCQFRSNKVVAGSGGEGRSPGGAGKAIGRDLYLMSGSTLATDITTCLANFEAVTRGELSLDTENDLLVLKVTSAPEKSANHQVIYGKKLQDEFAW